MFQGAVECDRQAVSHSAVEQGTDNQNTKGGVQTQSWELIGPAGV